MKNFFQIATLGLLLLITVAGSYSCKKEERDSLANKPPVINSGSDISLEIPQTDAILDAVASDADGIREYKWRKISGPSSCFIDEHNFPAKAIWLEEGVYEFELKVTDKTGLSAKDTVAVAVSTQQRKHIVNHLPSNSQYTEVQIPTEVHKNLKWVYCRSADRCERADDRRYHGVDYVWGGWYYELMPDNRISIYGGYNNQDFDLIIYY